MPCTVRKSWSPEASGRTGRVLVTELLEARLFRARAGAKRRWARRVAIARELIEADAAHSRTTPFHPPAHPDRSFP